MRRRVLRSANGEEGGGVGLGRHFAAGVQLLFALCCLVLSCEGQMDTSTPCLVVAFFNHINRLHLNGSYMNTVVSQEQNIAAIDYHYRMQHVYWITNSVRYGQIKRTFLNGTANVERIASFLPDPLDLAVDWVEDKVYWIGGDGRLGVVDIMSGDEAMILSTSDIHLILVDPIDRCLYCAERQSPAIKQVDYRGQTMNEDVTSGVSADSAGVISLAMSYNEHTILWAAKASQSIECQGLQNATFRRSYAVCDTCYINDINIFDGRVYWVQKSERAIYYTSGHLENGVTVEVIQYQESGKNIKGFRVVDLSCQPLTAADIVPDLTKAFAGDGEVVPSPSTRDPSSPILNPSEIVIDKSSEDNAITATSTTSHSIGTYAVYSTATTHRLSKTVSSPALQSPHVLSPSVLTPMQAISISPTTMLALSSTKMLSTIGTVLSSSSLSSLLSPSSSFTPTQTSSTMTSPVPTQTTLLFSSTQVLSTANTVTLSSPSVLSSLLSPSSLNSNSTLLATSLPLLTKTAGTQSQYTAIQSGLFTHTSLHQSVHIEPTSTIISTPTKSRLSTTMSTTLHSTISPSSALQPSSLTSSSSSTSISRSSSFDTSSTSLETDASFITFSSAQFSTVPSNTLQVYHTNLQSPSTRAEMDETKLTSSLSATIQPGMSYTVIIPSEAPATPNGKLKHTVSARALIITASCLCAAAVLLVGLALCDTAYYYCYERKKRRENVTGLFRNLRIWRLLTLPCRCITRHRRCRKLHYPYIPRCMNESDLSPYATSSSEQAPSFSSNLSDVSSDIYCGLSTTASGETTDYEMQTKAIADHECEKEDIFF